MIVAGHRINVSCHTHTLNPLRGFTKVRKAPESQGLAIGEFALVDSKLSIWAIIIPRVNSVVIAAPRTLVECCVAVKTMSIHQVNGGNHIFLTRVNSMKGAEFPRDCNARIFV